jgi:hypothetical protein
MLHAHYNSGINDIRLISRPIYAPCHELEDTDTNTPLTKVVSNRILVEFLDFRDGDIYTIYRV